jgi:hypothetical protein
MSDLKEEALRNLLKKKQAMPPSAQNQSDSPRFPINSRTGPSNSLSAAISAVGRARPNTPEERAKVRRYVMKVAKAKGWSDDIPKTWKPDGTLTTGGS